MKISPRFYYLDAEELNHQVIRESKRRIITWSEAKGTRIIWYAASASPHLNAKKDVLSGIHCASPP